jgi:hypothetical protein
LSCSHAVGRWPSLRQPACTGSLVVTLAADAAICCSSVVHGWVGFEYCVALLPQTVVPVLPMSSLSPLVVVVQESLLAVVGCDDHWCCCRVYCTMLMVVHDVGAFRRSGAHTGHAQVVLDGCAICALSVRCAGVRLCVKTIRSWCCMMVLHVARCLIHGRRDSASSLHTLL